MLAKLHYRNEGTKRWVYDSIDVDRVRVTWTSEDRLFVEIERVTRGDLEFELEPDLTVYLLNEAGKTIDTQHYYLPQEAETV